MIKKILTIFLIFLLCSCSQKQENKTQACILKDSDGSYTRYTIEYNGQDVYKLIEEDYANASSKENADEIYDLYDEIKTTFEDVDGFDVSVERIDSTWLKITLTTNYSIMSSQNLIDLLGFTEEEANAKKANFTYDEYINDLKSYNYSCD